MAKKYVHAAMAFAAMASVVTMSTAAVAQVRPGQSVVSAERAATSTTAFQTRAGADMKGESHLGQQAMIISFFALLSIGFGVYFATKKKTPTSP